MQINQEELRRRLDSTKNLAVSLPVRSGPPTGAERPAGGSTSDLNQQAKPEITKSAIATRIVAGSLALQGEPIRDIACEFGMTNSQVRSASKSYDPNIRGPIQSSLERVNELAIDKMLTVLGLMTSEKFADTNVKDLSTVAANMSRIIDNTRTIDRAASVQLIIYAPESRNERSYRVVDV